MEQINERREQILQYLQPYMEECFQKSCELIQTELDYHASEIWEALKCCINECLHHAGTMQQQQSKRETAVSCFQLFTMRNLF